MKDRMPHPVRHFYMGGKRLRDAFLAVVLFLPCAQAALALPQNGPSLGGGIGKHLYQDISSIGAGTTRGYSAGYGLLLDYQFTMGESVSLNPFMTLSTELASDMVHLMAGYTTLGAQLRYWFGGIYAGGYWGRYTSTLRGVTGQGPGWGMLAGWEKQDGGLFVQGMADAARAAYGAGEIKLLGFSLNVGYRWK